MYTIVAYNTHTNTHSRLDFHENGSEESEIKARHSAHIYRQTKEGKRSAAHERKNRPNTNSPTVNSTAKHLLLYGLRKLGLACMKSEVKWREKTEKKYGRIDMQLLAGWLCLISVLQKYKNICFFRMHILLRHGCATCLTVFEWNASSPHHTNTSHFILIECLCKCIHIFLFAFASFLYKLKRLKVKQSAERRFSAYSNVFSVFYMQNDSIPRPDCCLCDCQRSSSSSSRSNSRNKCIVMCNILAHIYNYGWHWSYRLY